ncbi:MAG: ROK family protein [Alphaproteobacteria bacterium]|nr:ROK family protein [Alphaproteobacteria bacterium]
MRIGLDLGGTKTSGILMNRDGQILARHRVESPRGDYHATLTMLRDLVTYLDKDSDTTTPVGIGIPGAVSPKTGLVKNANSTWLIGKPLLQDATECLGRPVRIANDADCFTLSEAVDGAGAGYQTVFGVILGTGVGGGIVSNGALLNGPNAITGEWGHNPLPWASAGTDPALPCYCGKSGCIETYLSGPGLSKHHAKTALEIIPAETIAAADSPKRQDSLKLYASRLARALSHVINILDPDAIVLGGGLSGIQSLYEDIPALWGKHVFSDAVSTPLLQNQHGPDSGVRGAAWLWPAE